MSSVRVCYEKGVASVTDVVKNVLQCDEDTAVVTVKSLPQWLQNRCDEMRFRNKPHPQYRNGLLVVETYEEYKKEDVKVVMATIDTLRRIMLHMDGKAATAYRRSWAREVVFDDDPDPHPSVRFKRPRESVSMLVKTCAQTEKAKRAKFECNQWKDAYRRRKVAVDTLQTTAWNRRKHLQIQLSTH